MAKLSELFDGEMHFLKPDEDFSTASHGYVADWEEIDEEEDLDPYETAILVPVLRRRPAVYPNGEPEGWAEQRAWGSLSVKMGSLAAVLGFKREQYQHNEFDANKILVARRYSFVLKDSGELGYEGGKI